VLDAALSLSYHRAHFTSGVASNAATDVSLAGHELTLSAAPAVFGRTLFAPPSGPSGLPGFDLCGAPLPGPGQPAPTLAYLIVDATIGYRIGRFVTRLSATTSSIVDLRSRRASSATPPIPAPGRRLEGTLAIDI